MFDVGFWEILLILVLALVVIGPERLPGAARTVGLWVGKSRRFIEGVKSDVEQEFDVSEFKRVIHNQEIQLKELQQQVSQQATLDSISGDGPTDKTHTLEEEVPASKESQSEENKKDD
jgi:sec-independent protein translocase protein TatB